MRATVLLAVSVVLFVFAGCLSDDDAPTGDDAWVTTGGFSNLAVPAGTYSDEKTWSQVLAPGPFEPLAGEVVSLDSEADGAAIQIGIVRPDVPAAEKVPVIVLASPYFSPLQNVDLGEYYPRFTKNFVPHGYAMAFLAVRGTADSGGCSDLFGHLEQADLDQAITWLGTQEWSNGNVGMIGVSYDGSTPWIVAATGNPYLKTIVPISGLSDVFHLEFRNGTVEQRMLGLVSLLYWGGGFLDSNPTNGRDAERTAQSVVCPAAFEGAAMSMTSALTGERDPRGYWNERNHRPGVETNYNGSILLIHGLQDWNVDPHHAYPWVNELEAKGLVVKHWLGQWGHAWPDSNNGEGIKRWDYAQKMLQWFDYWLKGDLSADLGPRAEVQDSEGQWRSDDTWPPANRTPLPLYLAPGATLTADEPTTSGNMVLGPDSSLALGQPLLGGPTGAAGCGACASFVGEPLEESLRFAGMPRVHVTVIPTAPTGHVAAFLYAYSAGEGGGTYTRLGWTQMDIRFHAGGEEASTVVPGEPIVMKMWLEPLDVVVPAGQSLLLVLSEGKQHDRLAVTPFAPMVLVAGAESVMTLDTFTPDPAAFFEVPSFEN